MNMKIKHKHFEHLKGEIESVLEKYPGLVQEYETGNFPRSESTKNLQQRFCFDLAYGAGLSRWISDNLYPYMNDNDLFTALKRIAPTVERKY